MKYRIYDEDDVLLVVEETLEGIIEYLLSVLKENGIKLRLSLGK